MSSTSHAFRILKEQNEAKESYALSLLLRFLFRKQYFLCSASMADFFFSTSVLNLLCFPFHRIPFKECFSFRKSLRISDFYNRMCVICCEKIVRNMTFMRNHVHNSRQNLGWICRSVYSNLNTFLLNPKQFYSRNSFFLLLEYEHTL